MSNSIADASTKVPQLSYPLRQNLTMSFRARFVVAIYANTLTPSFRLRQENRRARASQSGPTASVFTKVDWGAPSN
jgi:hypothetical protein